MTTPLVRLCVRVSNLEAQRMYQGLGYGNLDIWRRYYPNGEDALVMEKRRGRR
jgi:ribosomal-protein-alanine N-acetyltransferase